MLLVVDISMKHGVDPEAVMSHPITNFYLSDPHSNGYLLPPCTKVWQKKVARSRYIGIFRSDPI